MKRIFTTGAIAVALTACTTLSDVEKQALRDRAISDASSQPKEIHLAYLQCYALRDIDKDSCKRKVKQTIEGRKDASTWEYIRPTTLSNGAEILATKLAEHSATTHAK